MTLLEWYTARADYTHMIAQCRQLVRFLVERVLGKFYGFDRVHAMDWSWTIR